MVSQGGKNYILLVADQIRKWIEIHAVPDQNADHLAKVVWMNSFLSLAVSYSFTLIMGRILIVMSLRQQKHIQYLTGLVLMVRLNVTTLSYNSFFAIV